MMDIVFPMAIIAVGRELQVDRVFSRMARLARELLMPARQRIFCLEPMVEAPMRPTVRIVARCTLGSETSLVFVLVAFFTGERCVFISRRLMTIFAGHRSMQSDQGKSR